MFGNKAILVEMATFLELDWRSDSLRMLLKYQDIFFCLAYFFKKFKLYSYRSDGQIYNDTNICSTFCWQGKIWILLIYLICLNAWISKCQCMTRLPALLKRGRHGTDPWPTDYFCLLLIKHLLCLSDMFVHVCRLVQTCLFLSVC